MDTFVSEEEAAQFRDYMADPSARAAFVEFKASVAQNGQARRYEHVLRAVASRPWAIDEPMLAVIVDVLTFRAYGGRLTAEEIEGRLATARRTPSSEAPKGVARIPISGVIMPKASAMSDMSGGTSAEAVGQAIRAATDNPNVSSIVLDIDSPGGAVDGIPELASLIAQANTIKPVVAVANHEAASAAYWLASQAGRIIASPSARVGSIGVISKHDDESERAQREGVKTTLVSAGRFKAEGSPWEPLSEEAKVHLQSMVDEFYGMFVEGVARGRGVSAEAVKGGFGEGRVVTAKNALQLGMIDGIGTIEAVIQGELAAGHARATATGPHLVVATGPGAAPVFEGDAPASPVVDGQDSWPDVRVMTPVRMETAPEPERLGDGTPQDEEIERLRLAINTDPAEESTVIVEEVATPDGQEVDPEIQALKDELAVLGLPE
jgi:signal peptide peptidase SppA